MAHSVELADRRDLAAKRVGHPLSEKLKTAIDEFARAHGLTAREREVLECLVEGHVTAKELAESLALSVNTVHNHLKGIYGRTSTSGKSSVLLRLIHFASDGVWLNGN